MITITYTDSNGKEVIKTFEPNNSMFLYLIREAKMLDIKAELEPQKRQEYLCRKESIERAVNMYASEHLRLRGSEQIEFR